MNEGIAERAAAILHDELARGALANVAESRRVWSSARSTDLFAGEGARRLQADAEHVLETVLQLLRPDRQRLDARRDGESYRRASADLRPAVVRTANTVRPGETAELLARLINETACTTNLVFSCSELVAENGERIGTDCVAVQPRRVQLASGEAGSVAISVSIPLDARPEVYHAVLDGLGTDRLRAILRFPVSR